MTTATEALPAEKAGKKKPKAAKPAKPEAAPPAGETPAQRQYRQFEAQYPGYVLLFRVGDFYESFWAGAKTLAAVCGATLTTRAAGGGAEPIPMAGVPFHAVEGYLRQLIAAGHKVAVCEPEREAQGERAGGDKAVKREVVRLVSPDTLIGPASPPAATVPGPYAPAETAAAGPRWDADAVGPRFTADRVALLAAVSAAAGVIGRPHTAALACVRLDVTADGLTVESTGLERWAWHPVAQADAARPGACLINAKDLGDFLRESGAAAVQVDATGGRLIVSEVTGAKGGAAVVKLFGVDPAGWPSAGGDPRPAPLGTVAAPEFRRLVRQALSADPAAGASVKGVLVTTDGKSHLLMAATDGRRLVVTRASWSGKPVPPVVVPADALSLAAKAADDDDESTVGLWADDRAALFSFADGGGLRTAVLEAAFPPWQDVLPPAPPMTLTFNRDAFAGRLRQAALAADHDDAKGPHLVCQFGPWGARFSSRSGTRGESNAELACEWDGPAEGLTIGFNPDFLRAAVQACEADAVTLGLSAPNRPGLVTDGGSDCRVVLMPKNLQ